MHLNNYNSQILLRISIKRFMNKFFINTHLKNLINQKIMNILWNARVSYTLDLSIQITSVSSSLHVFLIIVLPGMEYLLPPIRITPHELAKSRYTLHTGLFLSQSISDWYSVQRSRKPSLSIASLLTPRPHARTGYFIPRGSVTSLQNTPAPEEFKVVDLNPSSPV